MNKVTAIIEWNIAEEKVNCAENDRMGGPPGVDATGESSSESSHTRMVSMTTTKIRMRPVKDMTCFAVGQENVSRFGQIATLKGKRPVVQEKHDRRMLRVSVHDHNPDTADMLD